MLALPVARLAEGVNVAVRVSPVPLTALSVPLETNTSPAVPFQINELPGSSLNVNVTVAVSPAFSAVLSLVMVSVGERVSIATTGVAPAPPGLPAASR